MPARIHDQRAHFWANVDKSGGPDACWPWMRYALAGRTWSDA